MKGKITVPSSCFLDASADVLAFRAEEGNSRAGH